MRTWQQFLVEWPHITIKGEIPQELSFLHGLVDLGFEDTGMLKELSPAYQSTGLRIPNTPYRLRLTGAGPVIELSDGSEESLPPFWKQCVLVFDLDSNVATWVGKRVRKDRRVGFDIKNYKDVGDGYVP